ncbi:hypothetical protein LX36DRAFT_708909 [Colletotrichum falcatum]|nr:hypothetical protein LX36DRAFT_708909 [Colletotrichum falcatum]
MSKPLPSLPSSERSPLLPPDDGGDDDDGGNDPDPSDLALFRRAVGINAAGDAPESPRAAAPSGIYAAAIAAHRRFRALRVAAVAAVYACHAAQLVVGAALTSLGPSAGAHRASITALGAVNTVVAGALAWARSRGLPGRLRRREAALRRVRDWIEETEALMALGTVGGTRAEVGALVDEAFARWHLAIEGGADAAPEPYRGEEDGEGARGKGLTARWLRGR